MSWPTNIGIDYELMVCTQRVAMTPVNCLSTATSPGMLRPGLLPDYRKQG